MADSPYFVYRKRCELCGSGRRVVLLSKRLSSPEIWDFLTSYYDRRLPRRVAEAGRYEVARCRDCGFVWQTEVLDPVHAALLYDRWVSPERSLDVKQHADLSLFAGYARQIELVARLCGKPQWKTTVLDFGMGWGHWCRMAAAYGFAVTGLETSQPRLDFAARLGVPILRALSEVGRERFDFVNAEQVFEHIPDPLATLRPLVAGLVAGGVVRISVPDCGRSRRELGRREWSPSKNALQPLEHVNGFSHRTLLSLGRKAGLLVLSEPFLPGQGLLGKSHRHGLLPWLKSVAGVPYRRFLGTTLWFRKVA